MKQNIGHELGIINSLMIHSLNQYKNNHCNQSYKGFDNLSRASIFTVIYLFENQDKDIFQKDLEKTFSIRRSTASSLISTLEDKGYVNRIPMKNDKRLKKLELTEKSHNALKVFKSANEYINKKLIKDIPNDELMSFYSTLQKMKQNLEKED